MDKRKNNGGARVGAGRPTKADQEELVNLLDKHINRDEAILKLKERILELNDLKAIQLWMSYIWGKPIETQQVSMDADQPIFNITKNIVSGNDSDK